MMADSSSWSALLALVSAFQSRTGLCSSPVVRVLDIVSEYGEVSSARSADERFEECCDLLYACVALCVELKVSAAQFAAACGFGSGGAAAQSADFAVLLGLLAKRVLVASDYGRRDGAVLGDEALQMAAAALAIAAGKVVGEQGGSDLAQALSQAIAKYDQRIASKGSAGSGNC